MLGEIAFPYQLHLQYLKKLMNCVFGIDSDEHVLLEVPPHFFPIKEQNDWDQSMLNGPLPFVLVGEFVKNLLPNLFGKESSLLVHYYIYYLQLEEIESNWCKKTIVKTYFSLLIRQGPLKQ